MIFDECITYSNGERTAKHYISTNDSNAKEVTESTYHKLNINEFEKLKNIPEINIKKDTNKETKKLKIENKTSWEEPKKEKDTISDVADDKTISELVDMIRSSTRQSACSKMHSFLNNFIGKIWEIGYQTSLADIEDLLKTLREAEEA